MIQVLTQQFSGRAWDSSSQLFNDVGYKIQLLGLTLGQQSHNIDFDKPSQLNCMHTDMRSAHFFKQGFLTSAVRMFGTWGFFVKELSWAMGDNDNPLWFLSPGACSTHFLLWQPKFSRNWCAFLGNKTDMDWDSLVSTPQAPFSVLGIMWVCFSWNGQMNSDYCTFLSCCMQNHLQWCVGSEPLFQEKLRHLYYFWLMTFSSFTVMLNIYLLLNYNPRSKLIF